MGCASVEATTHGFDFIFQINTKEYICRTSLLMNIPKKSRHGNQCTICIENDIKNFKTEYLK